MAKIQITNLRLRTIIGANDWERDNKQDIVINITIEFDAEKASKSDNLNDTIDYKTLSKAIIEEVEGSSYFLLEALCRSLLDIIMKEKTIEKAVVKIDKPFALRFADSVSVELEEDRNA